MTLYACELTAACRAQITLDQAESLKETSGRFSDSSKKVKQRAKMELYKSWATGASVGLLYPWPVVVGGFGALLISAYGEAADRVYGYGHRYGQRMRGGGVMDLDEDSGRV